MTFVRAGALALSALPLTVALSLPGQTAQPGRTFEKDVLPILRAHCFDCHSGSDARAKLNLESAAGLLKGGRSGPAIVPGRSAESLLVQRIKGQGGKEQMPLGFAPLSAAQVTVICDWIDQGAKEGTATPTHWSYVPPVKAPLPVVQNRRWVRNPIDAFVLARLEKEGLRPSPEASKETLIRRVYLDLIGLPPSPTEIDAFLRDQSPSAYEKVVDSLLANPHFGERMARPWLDLARYADSDGYEKDANRVAWEYRDWVIDAFNRNMPYDEFTVEQLAGDMLPHPTTGQLIATGFHRNTMFNQEGGVDPAEAMYTVILDRVATTATVWMGSTLGCARCHDHKYDPFTQKDFYSVYAVFANNAYTAVGDNNVGQLVWIEPTIRVPTADQLAEQDRLQAESARLAAKLETPTNDLKTAFDAWVEASRSNTEIAPTPQSASSANGQTLTRLKDGSYWATGSVPDNDTYAVSFRGPLLVTGVRLEALPGEGLVSNGPGRSTSGNFILTGLQVSLDGETVPLSRAEASFSQQGYDSSSVIGGKGPGWAIYPEEGKANELLAVTEKPVRVGAGQTLSVALKFDDPNWKGHVLGHFRVGIETHENPRVMPSAVREALGKSDRSPEEQRALWSYFVRVNPSTRADALSLEADRQALEKLKSQFPAALILRDKPTDGPLKANIHVRGEFLNKGDEVQAAAPAFLPPMPKGIPVNRLTFARWLVSRGNPLTARVEVNRLWEMVFGRGIVETCEDFGTQGTPPSHPELLDWLAVQFMDKWDVKAMLRLIVTSSTYRQSSSATPALAEKDPQNVLLARGPRFRMEAEMVRDNALAVSGLLDPQIGGPSVFPEQPSGVWDTPYNGEQWTTSSGGQAHRRGLYTFLKRSAPYPSFLALDATARDVCTVRRLRTNTPLQALALLNDSVMMEAARGLAGRMKYETDGSRDMMLRHGFRLCTGRLPSAPELTRLIALHDKLVGRYRQDQQSAKKVGSDPDDAALVMVANTLLNLDETITKE